MANFREGLRQPLEPGGGTIERAVDDAVVFGDEGFAVWYGYGEGGVVATRQYIIYARVAAQFVSVEVNDLPADAEAPAAAMATLMAAQVACLEAEGWCEPVPVPAALKSRNPIMDLGVDRIRAPSCERQGTTLVHHPTIRRVVYETSSRR